jgi:hypothetical protein
MKVLVLVMSHKTEDPVFKGYKDVWDKKLSILKEKGYNIDVLFLYSDENIDQDYTIIGNELYTKCTENYWASLLLKAMSGFDHFVKSDYDLVFKTNLSTIINLDKFYKCCESILNSEEYVYHGVVGKYENYEYISGAGMLLNKKSVNLIIGGKSEITPQWTDDIFFGHILNRRHGITPKMLCMDRYNLIDQNQQVDPKSVMDSSHIRIKVRSGNKDVEFSNRVFEILYT